MTWDFRFWPPPMYRDMGTERASTFGQLSARPWPGLRAAAGARGAACGMAVDGSAGLTSCGLRVPCDMQSYATSDTYPISSPSAVGSCLRHSGECVRQRVRGQHKQWGESGGRARCQATGCQELEDIGQQPVSPSKMWHAQMIAFAKTQRTAWSGGQGKQRPESLSKQAAAKPSSRILPQIPQVSWVQSMGGLVRQDRETAVQCLNQKGAGAANPGTWSSDRAGP